MPFDKWYPICSGLLRYSKSIAQNQNIFQMCYLCAILEWNESAGPVFCLKLSMVYAKKKKILHIHRFLSLTNSYPRHAEIYSLMKTQLSCSPSVGKHPTDNKFHLPRVVETRWPGPARSVVLNAKKLQTIQCRGLLRGPNMASYIENRSSIPS